MGVPSPRVFELAGVSRMSLTLLSVLPAGQVIQHSSLHWQSLVILLFKHMCTVLSEQSVNQCQRLMWFKALGMNKSKSIRWAVLWSRLLQEATLFIGNLWQAWNWSNNCPNLLGQKIHFQNIQSNEAKSWQLELLQTAQWIQMTMIFVTWLTANEMAPVSQGCRYKFWLPYTW